MDSAKFYNRSCDTLEHWQITAVEQLLACAILGHTKLVSCLNQLYARLNGMQLILNAEIDYFHVISIFKKLLTKD